MPESKQVPMTCSIWVTNVRAYPAPGRLAAMRDRISMVSSASQSPVKASIGPPETISDAAESRSPKKPLQLAIRIGGAVLVLMNPRLG